ncbi:MAG: hypothetical protein APF84_12315 [Gracilibacter sp. BRH_c7a]|nr:MAG: hypothetical protein APF84_12315 [Gracilibacter sp. BRH_c7a]
MNSFLGLLTIIIFILIIHLGLDSYLKIKNKHKEDLKSTIDVLKVITKHECYEKFSGDSTEFEKWIAEFLTLKGYRNVLVSPKESDDGKDIIVQNKNGETVYVSCKLSDPQNWENNVSKSEIQKLVGSMVGDSIKAGLVITTAALNSEAKEYIMKLNGLGYRMQIIEGDVLVKELYNLRKKHLIPLYNSVQG